MTAPPDPVDGAAGAAATQPGATAQRPAELGLTLLGGFVLRVGGAVVALPTGGQRLVALLALRGGTSRSRLAGTLWPETSEERALASLRTGIWRVNQAVPGSITGTAGVVRLAPEADVDVARLVHGARTTLRPGGAGVGAVAELLQDCGELLPDWEDEWLLPDRERLHQMRLHVLEALAEGLAASGRHGLALEAALAALRMDALRESAHRAVIRIHLAEGNVMEARRAYDRCRDVLVRDVGVEPSVMTSRLLAPDPARAAGVPRPRLVS